MGVGREQRHGGGIWNKRPQNQRFFMDYVGEVKFENTAGSKDRERSRLATEIGRVVYHGRTARPGSVLQT